jgi:AcrR family transcriptional regulator
MAEPAQETQTAAGATPDAAVGRKAEQVIAGARTVIFARGFEGASVDDIAREAGVSKATMYRYFPDKSALFAAVMRRDCGRQADVLCGMEIGDRPIGEVLGELARRYLGFVLSPHALMTFRTVVAEAERFPEVGRAFYAAGRGRCRAWLAPALAAAAERGELALDDPEKAADQFFALCLGDMFLRRLMGLGGDCCDEEVETQAREAVAAFLRLHRPD